MNDDLERARREVRPDTLASMRRLDAALQRADVRWEGRTVREWLALYVAPQGPLEALTQLREAGLGAVPAMLEALEVSQTRGWGEAEHERRLVFLDLLAQVDPVPTGIVPALLEVLEVPGARVRRAVLALMAKLEPRPTKALLRGLFACLKDRDGEVRARAAQVCSRLDGAIPASIRDAVLGLLTDENRWARCYALVALGRVTPPESSLVVVLEEQAQLDDDNRTEALRALLVHAPERAMPLLVEEARKGLTSTDVWGAQHASGVRALCLLREQGSQAASVLGDLRRLKSEVKSPVFIDAAIDAIVRDGLRPRESKGTTEGAARAAALRVPLPPPLNAAERPVDRLVRWAVSCGGPGTESRVRIVLAASRRVVGLWDVEYPDNEWPRRGLQAMEGWVGDPTEAAARHARHEASLYPSQLSAPAAFAAAWAVTHASRCIPVEGPVEPHERDVDDGALRACLQSATKALSTSMGDLGPLGGNQRAPDGLSASEAVRVLHRAIQDEVLPWALGTGDPVVEVRRERDRLDRA
ncbi:HEAT repeat domain-containing protein [Myxococcus landrumensis]|uniref:HEAT repeat domain-containing protein n=1 Tax=Myxococcus landrumensis TaxID=2813577 RepID=A0ABX7N369_9BACT|nr:HEAT repeat domain-containing protein [Myxococcus landrumus]QSQ13172.1 HEAT repeat domain-containing protein [Myxococcus landrumus]